MTLAQQATAAVFVARHHRGAICLRVRRRGSSAVISVIDRGIGISAGRLPRIFDLFTQGGDSETRTQSIGQAARTSGGAQAATAALFRRSFVVVDDNRDAADCFGAEVAILYSGREALQHTALLPRCDHPRHRYAGNGRLRTGATAVRRSGAVAGDADRADRPGPGARPAGLDGGRLRAPSGQAGRFSTAWRRCSKLCSRPGRRRRERVPWRR